MRIAPAAECQRSSSRQQRTVGCDVDVLGLIALSVAPQRAAADDHESHVGFAQLTSVTKQCRVCVNFVEVVEDYRSRGYGGGTCHQRPRRGRQPGAEVYTGKVLFSHAEPDYTRTARPLVTGSVHIPAEAVDPLRDGLRSLIAGAARRMADRDGLAGESERSEHDQADLRRIDALRALLREIAQSTPPRDLDVDPRAHAWALVEALGDQIAVHADMLRDTDGDEERPEALTRDAGALQALALTVLLAVQAQTLSPAPRPGREDSERVLK